MPQMYELINDEKTLKKLFETAKECFAEFVPEGYEKNLGNEKTATLLKDTLERWRVERKTIQTRKDVFRRLLGSSINSYSKPSVFGGIKDGRDERLACLLKTVSGNFDVKKMATSDVWKLDKLIRDARKKIVGAPLATPTDPKSKLASPYKLASSIKQSAEHLMGFSFPQDENFAECYRKQHSSIENGKLDLYKALFTIRQFSQNISGISFSLSCDFLKEIGLYEYGKPDTHVMDLLPYFTGNLYKNNGKQEAFGQCLIDIIRVANTIKVKPYEFDKLLYVIGKSNSESASAISRELTGTSAGRKKRLKTMLKSVLEGNGYVIPAGF